MIEFQKIISSCARFRENCENSCLVLKSLLFILLLALNVVLVSWLRFWHYVSFFSRQRRAQFSKDVYVFVLWRYVAVQIWHVKELFVPERVISFQELFRKSYFVPRIFVKRKSFCQNICQKELFRSKNYFERVISFQEYLSKGISHPVFYGDRVYKLRRVKDTPNFISSGSKIVKRLPRRQHDPVIIERTIGLVLGPSTALYEPFLKYFTLTNKAERTLWSLSPLIVSRDSFGHQSWARFQPGGAQPALFGCR